MALFKHTLTTKVSIGKYKNYLLIEAIDIDPSYIEWIRVNAKNNFEMDEKSKAYLADKLSLYAIRNMNKHLNKRYRL